MSFSPPTRPKPENAAEIVAAMPRRMAHALHALLTHYHDEATPGIASEIMVYDEEALTARSTAAALNAAQRQGYCGCASGVWYSLPKAMDLRSELEDRYLSETEELK